jgi:ankyrin repeat protein
MLDIVRALVENFGAEINLSSDDGLFLPLVTAADKGHKHVLRALVHEYGADINQATIDGVTALYMAARNGHEALVRCIVEEFGADVNQAMLDGSTPLMAASAKEHKMVAKYLIKHGADPQAYSPRFGTAADLLRKIAAPAHLIAYLEAKAHCANSGCSGVGLRKCTGCKKARYCGQQCQLAHWAVHKVECKQSAGPKAGKGKSILTLTEYVSLL